MALTVPILHRFNAQEYLLSLINLNSTSMRTLTILDGQTAGFTGIQTASHPKPKERVCEAIMKPEARRRPVRLSGVSQGVGKEYLEFELDPETLLEIEALASKRGCTPFQMSVTLLQQELSRISAG
jgi:hypothetical protein